MFIYAPETLQQRYIDSMVERFGEEAAAIISALMDAIPEFVPDLPIIERIGDEYRTNGALVLLELLGWELRSWASEGDNYSVRIRIEEWPTVTKKPSSFTSLIANLG